MKCNFLDKNTALQIKGLAAFWVMFGHFIASGFSWPMQLLNAGFLWVGIFFFFSAYGLKIKSDQTEGYPLKSLLGQLFKLLLPYIIAETIFIILNQTSNSILWYVWHILFYYVVFWIVNRFDRIKENNLFWLSLFVFYLAIMFITDTGTYWYISSSPLLMGLAAWKYSSIIDKLRSNPKYKITICIVFPLLYLIMKYLELFGTNLPYFGYIITLFYLGIVPLFVLFVSTVVELIHRDSKILNFLGKISYELYLYQMIVKNLIYPIVDNAWLALFTSLLLTVVISYIMHLLHQVIFHIIKKRPSQA